MKKARWTVYILRCADGTLYTGITNNLEARLAKHTRGTGAKYTRGRGPFEVLFSETHASKGKALKKEILIKSFNKKNKLAFIESKPRRK